MTQGLTQKQRNKEIEFQHPVLPPDLIDTIPGGNEAEVSQKATQHKTK